LRDAALAVDTNVLIRFITQDDPGQHSRARSLLQECEILIARTVLLETEWVLRSAYGFAPKRICEALQGILGLPKVHVEDPFDVAKALEWTADSLDFADALHLAACGPAGRFVTFDGRLAKRARKITQMEIVQL
jgi:predicted nucleic acid-binding protein